ncbi:DUF917 domain-containing protein [Candidatus Gottesmanbacteria bacterium]|nr:DUF917 domain-containing protein [Candidatus Gottesmanbacteria bacterium]
MRAIKKTDIPAIVEGSLFYGTGGGGDPARAQAIWERLARQKRLPAIYTLSEFSNGICVTAFPVGGLKVQSISTKCITAALATLQKRLAVPIVGIIPVEIGSLPLALSAEVAALLNLPLVDADFVGGRSTPEVFLETITLFDIPRTPLVVVNRRGDVATLEKASSPVAEEEFLRTFSTMTEGFAYVFGYPISIAQAKRAVTQNTVSQALNMGNEIGKNSLRKAVIRLGGRVFCTGTILAIDTIDNPGFSAQMVVIKTSRGKCRIFTKNENMIFWMNDKPILTCPDLIILLDENDRPLFNQSICIGKTVSVVGMPAASLWRTTKGKKLFCPRVFGFKFDTVLLS